MNAECKQIASDFRCRHRLASVLSGKIICIMLPVKAGAAVPAVFKMIGLSSLEGTAKASPDEVCSVLH